MTYFEQPEIYLWGLRINEPVTTLTDLMVSAVCFFAFYKLSKIPVKNKVHQFITYYFLSMGLATTIGGIIGHAFMYNFSFYWKLPGWITSMFSIMLLERASIEYTRPLISKGLGIAFKWINLIELTTFIIITMITLNFFFVEVHSAYGLLFVVTSLNIYVYKKKKTKGSKTFLIAVGFSAISALFYMNQWGLNEWFTHTDISHVFMTISAWYFYKGSRYILNDPLLNTEG